MDAVESIAVTIDAKRKRAKHSKTRKGCARCKQRHIKCDETKPSCARCEQANLPCPGYEETTTLRNKRGPARRIRFVQGPQTLVIAPALRQDQTTLSLDEDIQPPRDAASPHTEQTAIDYFTSETLTTLATYSPESELWTTAAFTRLTADAKIRNAVIAIGLAHEDLRANYRRGNGPNTALSDRSGLEKVLTPDALDCDRYYNAALAYMRVDISWVKEDTTRDRLDVAVACLLFVIYLSLQDRMEEAAVHMHCGLDIVSEGGESFLSASGVHRETYLYFLNIATSSWPVHPSASLFALIQQTSQLSCHLVDMTPLQSLRADCDFFAHRIFQYTSIVTRGYFGDPKDMHAMKNDLLEESDIIGEKIDDYAGLIDIDESATDMPHSLDLMFIKLLRARLILYRLFSQSVSTRYQTTYDRYTQDFDDAITLIGQAIKIGSAVVGVDWPLFSINLNIIGVMSQSTFLCRHPVIRRKAMNMLRFCPQREGILEVAETRQLNAMTIDFEENGVNLDPTAKYPMHIPEENRLHFVESIRKIQIMDMDIAEDEILVRMMYRPDGDSGYVERRVRVKKDTYKNGIQLLDQAQM